MQWLQTVGEEEATQNLVAQESRTEHCVQEKMTTVSGDKERTTASDS